MKKRGMHLPLIFSSNRYLNPSLQELHMSDY